MEEYFPLFMFPALLIAILSGFPVAFVLAAVGVIFGLIGHFYLDIFLLSDFGFVPSKIFGVIGNVTLIAVPLFIFMGITLERSGVAEDLLQAASFLLRKISGGLLFGLVLVGALLAASTGIVGATVVTMAVLSFPTLQKQSYDVKLSCGTICAAGTLGQIIPPSIVLILLADMMNIAVADLFAAAIIPSLILVALYLLFILWKVWMNPNLCPNLETLHEDTEWSIAQCASAIIPPLFLMITVLGSILFGIASPTESAACGASLALLIAYCKRKMDRSIIWEISSVTTRLTAMVFALLFGAQVFSVVFRGMYGDEILIELLEFTSSSPNLLLLSVMILFFVLGFFLDFLEICFIFVPIITPVLTAYSEFPALWIAILIAINLQTSFLTPPFGFSLFYLRGVVPRTVSTGDIYRGAFPFVFLQLLVIGIVYLFPALVLWLPKTLWN